MASAHLSPDDEIRLAELDARIVEQKRAGHSFQAIADAEHLSKPYVWRRYQRALRRIPERAVTEYRAEQLARIEAEREVVLEAMHARHVVVSNGHVVSEIVGTHPLIDETTGEAHPKAGEPIYGDALIDDGPILAAIDRLIKLDAQESDLLGLKAPAKVEMGATVNYTVGGGVDPASLT